MRPRGYTHGDPRISLSPPLCRWHPIPPQLPSPHRGSQGVGSVQHLPLCRLQHGPDLQQQDARFGVSVVGAAAGLAGVAETAPCSAQHPRQPPHLHGEHGPGTCGQCKELLGACMGHLHPEPEHPL